MELIKNISLVISMITNGIFIIISIWNAVNQIIGFLKENRHKNNRQDSAKF